MAEDYDPEEFSVRVSQSLFHVLAGRASDPVAIEPRTARESALVEAVRKDEERKRTLLLRAVKQQRAKDAVAQTEAVQKSLESAAAELDKKFDGISMNVPASADDLPCAQLRKETLQCYQKSGAENPADCIPQVEAFTACARNVSKLNS